MLLGRTYNDETEFNGRWLLQLIVDIKDLIVRLLAIFGFAAVILVFLLFDFMSRSGAHNADHDLPRTAIVFTGDFDRIHFGLDLLFSGRVDRLFITGVNGEAGLNVARFPKQFELSSEQVGWMERGQLVLAPDAQSTLENAREAACWLDHQPGTDAVALITSRSHMARASVALQHGIAPIRVVRVVSDAPGKFDKSEINLVEFGKFSATWIVTLLPRAFWPADEPKNCRVE
jgi:uncharacterized SAM-binding protein YcdF (DUF218 family)